MYRNENQSKVADIITYVFFNELHVQLQAQKNPFKPKAAQPESPIDRTEIDKL